MELEILDNCIVCGACQAIAPDVFKIQEVCVVDKKECASNKKECIEAALLCPVSAIVYKDV